MYASIALQLHYQNISCQVASLNSAEFLHIHQTMVPKLNKIVDQTFFLKSTFLKFLLLNVREIVVPALTSLTAQSPGLTPFRSPSGPMHRVAATGLPEDFKTWTAHSASSMCSKYWKEAQNVKTAELLKQFKAAVGALWYPSALQRPAAFLGQSFWFSGQANEKK